MKLENLTIVTCKIVAEVGSFIRDEFNNFDKNKVEKKGLNDLVSYVDKEAEEALMEELELVFSEAGFITEESGRNDDNEYNWVIDPLDGTTNFVHGVPVCSVSVALIKNNEVQIGVVYDVVNDETYYAWKDGGAYKNAEEITVSGTRRLSDSLVGVGFPINQFDRMDDYFSILGKVIKGSHGIRRLGSAALDLCFVACGMYEAFYEYNLNPWDVAAGALIVKEAGGKVSDFGGEENYVFGKEIVASNNNIHAEMKDIIRASWIKNK